VYQGLFDTRRGLSEEDFGKVGLTTAVLLLTWNRWTHRRVESARFIDADAARRSVSVDFTLPHFVHRLRETPEHGTRRQLVPLGLLRKGTLVNFDLRDEAGHSLPLLTTAQNGQVAEATLVALAAATLKIDVIHDAAAIQCDIRHLVQAPGRAEASRPLAELFEKRDQLSQQRLKLRDDDAFPRIAAAFATHFLALTVAEIARHQRRVFYYAYDETLFDSPDPGRFLRIARGGERVVWFTVPRVGEAESYHHEVEAPDGMQVNTQIGISTDRRPAASRPLLRPISKSGNFQRSHAQFSNAEPGDEAVIVVKIRPRPSTVIRGAVLGGFVSLALIVLVGTRLGPILAHGGTETAATLLLAIPGIAVAVLGREDDTEMTTEILWPIRVAALAPGLGAFIAAGAVVGGGDDTPTRLVLLFALLITVIGLVDLLVALRHARDNPPAAESE
jgi:hypothetical protein